MNACIDNRSSWIILLILFSFISLTALADSEPNDLQSQANFVALNFQISGDLGGGSPPDAADWYFTITNANGDFTAQVNFNPSIFGNVSIFRKDGTFLAGSANGNNVSTTASCVGADTLFVRVLRASGSGNYSLTNSLATLGLANDAEPNDILQDANPTVLNVTNTGQLGYFTLEDGTDIQDWYGFVTGYNGNVTAQLDVGGDFTANIGIFTKTGGLLASSSNTTTTIAATALCRAADTMFVRVLRASGCGDYSFNIVLDSTELEDDPEPNDILQQASDVALNEVTSGHLGYANSSGTDVLDWYRFITTYNGDVTAQLNVGGDFTANIAIFGKTGGLLAGSANTTDTTSTVTLCRAPDTMFVRVQRASGCGDYTIQVRLDSIDLQEDAEPNNSVAEAAPLLLNSLETGHLGYSTISTLDANDYYRFVTTSDGDVTVTVDFGGTLTGNVSLLTKTGGSLGGSSNGSGIVSFTAICRAADTLIAKVTRASGCGSYDIITTKTTLPLANDLEPNNNTNSVKKSIVPLEVTTGHLGYTNVESGLDQSDFYYLIVPTDGNVTFTAEQDTNSSLFSNIGLFTKNGGFLGGSGNAAGTISFTASCQAGDTLIGRINRAAGCGSYAAYFDVQVPPFIEDAEPNNLISQAIPIAFGQVKYGHLAYADADEPSDNVDFYSFNIASLPSPMMITVEATLDSTLTGNIALFAPGGGFLGGSGNGTGVIAFTTTISNPGTYSVRIMRASGCGSYWIGNGPAAVPCVFPPQSLNASSIKATTAVLSWSPVPGAIRYVVRGGIQGIGVNNYLVIERPIGAPTALFASILKPNTTYEWQVKAICSQNDFLETGWSSLNTFTTLSCDATTADSTSMITATTARLNWTPSPVAQGYEIVGSKVGSPGVVTLFVPGGATSFFDVANLGSGDTYMWGVRVVCTVSGQPKITSPLSNILTFTTLGTPQKQVGSMPEDYFRSWMIYPNPAQNELNLMIGDEFSPQDAKVRLYDMNGTMLLTKSISGTFMTISTKELSNGAYLVGISNAEGMEYMKRLIIAR